jgi:general L-amino acid transport system substrate-binding protein
VKNQKEEGTVKRKTLSAVLTLLILVSLVLAACGATEEPEGSEAPVAAGERMPVILERGKIICGCNQELPGFGYLNPQGEFEGFDIDFCKALAAAVFGDANAVEYRPLTAAERLPALQTGEIDVLIRNTTWTLTRDSKDNALNWAGVNFQTLQDMEGATVCTTTGTTTEMNLADAFRALGVEYTPLLFEKTQDTNEAYESGRCDGETSDKSQLAALRSAMANPDDHVILDVTMSKEPLGPLTAHGADQWNDVVRWVLFGMIQAEESGVSSQNLDEMLNSDDPTIRRLLGVEGGLGTSLGIPDDFMVNVIRAVGNYGEVYERWLGPAGLDIPRGPNELWTKGGLLYSMAFR